MSIRLETSNTESAKRMLELSKFKPNYSESHANRNMNSATSRTEIEREKRQSNYDGKKENNL